MPKRKTDRIEVTPDNFGELLVQGAREALAVSRGELAPARVRNITKRDVTVPAPPAYDAATVKAIRGKLKLSQAVFAQTLNISLATVRSWEQGVREPDGASRRLLQLAERNPGALLLAGPERG